jgi:hypothetical protein
MTFTDRVLVVLAVLSGLLLVQQSARGGPDGPKTCTFECQQTKRYYDCTKKHAYEYFLDDCYHCVYGACVKRDRMPGGACRKAEQPRKWRYIKGYARECECDEQVVRVEVSGGANTTDWDMFDADVYHVCQPSTATLPPPTGGL